jgi:glycosyltransferase involved in cell wall biosynthesis
MTDLVSILIPAYNAERWVSDAIKSAIGQTWHRKEIIVVDDGSCDSTLAIATQFESTSVKVLSQENRGASAARNKALEHAQGDYVQWLDADDLLADNKVSEQMRIAECSDALTILSCPFAHFYSRPRKAKFLPSPLWQDLAPIEFMIYHLSEGFWMSPAVWLMSRKLTQIAGPWNEGLSLNDDGEYFCRAIGQSKAIKFVPAAQCFYRTSGVTQLSRSKSDSACRSLLMSLKLCMKHLRSLEDSERTRKACLSCLQYYLGYFYPDKSDLLEEINAFAIELGGKLTVPHQSLKFRLLSKIVGWKSANRILTTLRRLKLRIAVRSDEILYKSAISFEQLQERIVNRRP